MKKKIKKINAILISTFLITTLTAVLLYITINFNIRADITKTILFSSIAVSPLAYKICELGEVI